MGESKDLYWKGARIYLLSFFSLILILIALYDSVIIWDEAAYLGNARSYLRESYFQEDFRFPALEWFIALAWYVVGESIFIAKAVIILFTIGSVYLFYRTARVFFDEKHALFAAILFTLSPPLIAWGYRVYADIPGLFFITAALYFSISDHKNHVWCALFVGILCALAFLVRFPLALFGLAVGCTYLVQKQWKQAIVFVVGTLATILSWMIYNYFTYGNPLWDLIEQAKVVAMYTVPEPAFLQFLNLFSTMSILALFLPLGYYWLWKEKRNVGLTVLVYSAIFFIYYFLFVNLKFSRYYLAALSILYIAAYAGVVYLADKIRNKNLKHALYGIILAVVIFTFVIQASIIYTTATCSRNGALIQSADYIVERTNEGDNILSNFWPYFGYYGNLRVHHFYTTNVNELLNAHTPKYAIYGNVIGAEFDKNLLETNEQLVLEKTIRDSCGVEVAIYAVR